MIFICVISISGTELCQRASYTLSTRFATVNCIKLKMFFVHLPLWTSRNLYRVDTPQCHRGFEEEVAFALRTQFLSVIFEFLSFRT